MKTGGRALRELAQCLRAALHQIADAAAIYNRLARPGHKANTADHADHDLTLSRELESKKIIATV
jgi:hypothetical protein